MSKKKDEKAPIDVYPQERGTLSIVFQAGWRVDSNVEATTSDVFAAAAKWIEDQKKKHGYLFNVSRVEGGTHSLTIFYTVPTKAEAKAHKKLTKARQKVQRYASTD